MYREPTDKRMFVLAAALKAGYDVDDLYEMTKIDRWFLFKMRNIIDWYGKLEKRHLGNIPRSYLLEAKKLGFSDKQIASLLESSEMIISKRRREWKITPWIKQIDTVKIKNTIWKTFFVKAKIILFRLLLSGPLQQIISI